MFNSEEMRENILAKFREFEVERRASMSKHRSFVENMPDLEFAGLLSLVIEETQKREKAMRNEEPLIRFMLDKDSQ